MGENEVIVESRGVYSSGENLDAFYELTRGSQGGRGQILKRNARAVQLQFPEWPLTVFVRFPACRIKLKTIFLHITVSFFYLLQKIVFIVCILSNPSSTQVVQPVNLSRPFLAGPYIVRGVSCLSTLSISGINSLIQKMQFRLFARQVYHKAG